MANEIDKEIEEKYLVIIPRNVLDNNQYISPKFKGRNVIEAIIVVLLFVAIQAGIKLSGIPLAVYATLGLSGAFFAFIGINGVSLSQYLIYIIRFNRAKRTLGPPDKEYDKKRDRKVLRKEI